ncbi:PREDICTED: glycerol-3-phosphate dehydrogenase [NAD(+)], cytoplasmic-like, partial [Rhagoletis zephyria]|uniref:glycerol-3-phosphate dehydrogenase [NAD(+)], cytoplasmic-like n=1 Tax=Rhagoletis zephyria TaxID=28612 RepID=UPI0008119EDF
MDLVKRVAIVGSGNWGSAIAKIIGANTARYPHFHTAVKMYVHEEEVEHSGTVRPLSEVINETHENVKYLPGHQLPVNVHTLGIAEVAVLMGANLAHEVAEGHFCETTIGVRTALSGKILKHLFQTDNFRVTYVQDVFTVEGCGAIKNIIGCAAGFVD